MLADVAPDNGLVTLILGSGGALVVLILWVWDLRGQRDAERARVSELTDRYATSIAAGNDRIRDLTDAVLDAMDALRQAQGQPPARRRRTRVE